MDSEIDALCNRDITRYLNLLRSLIRDSGWTQLKVQDQLGWGRSYISQLMTEAKTLRVDQVLKILTVIGVSWGDFFAQLYSTGRSAAVPLQGNPEVQALRAELDSVKARVEGLLSFLEGKGVLDGAELAATIENARAEP